MLFIILYYVAFVHATDIDASKNIPLEDSNIIDPKPITKAQDPSVADGCC